MQGTPSSHIENLGLHGPQVAQRLSDRGAYDLSHLADSPVGQRRVSNSGMTAEELDQAIKRACTASEAWYSQFKHLGDLACLDMAHHFMGIACRLEHLRSSSRG